MAGRISGITIEIGGDTTKLQTALKGVDSQLKQTQNALKDVNKLLKLDPGNTDLLVQKQKNLEKAVDQTKQRLQQLKDAQKGVAQGTPEWDALQREIIETEQNLKGLENDLRNFGSVGAQQIAAAGQAMADFGDKVTAAGEKLKPVSAAAAAIAAALIGMGVGAASTADDLNTLSQQSGLSTDTLQQLGYAADRIDVSMDTVAGAATKMKKAMAGGGEAFATLGVSVTDAEGNMRGVEEVFWDTVSALSGIGNETERDQLAMEIFGKSADQLAGIIDDGGAAFREYAAEAENLGLILSGDTLKELNKTNDAIDKSKAQLKAATTQLGATIATGLAPAIEKIAQCVESLVGWLQKLTPEQTNLIITIALVVAAIAPLLIGIGHLITTVGMLLMVWPVLAGAFAAISAPVLVVIGIIAALIAIGVLLYKNWDEIKAKAQEIWGNIVSAVTGFVGRLKSSLSEFAAAAKQSIIEMWETIKAKFTEAIQTIKDTIQKWIDAAKAKVAQFTDIGRAVVDNIKQGISNAWNGLTSWFKGIWDAVFGNLRVNVDVYGTNNTGYGAMTGLDFVPFNGFPAILHRGEAVLTAGEAQHWREGGSGGIDYDRLASAIASRPIVIQGDSAKIFKVVRDTNNTRTRATNYNALAMG